MKKKILIALVFSLLFVGCGKKDNSKTTEPTTETTTETTEETELETEEEKDPSNISIFTKDMEIKYDKVFNKEGKFEGVNEFLDYYTEGSDKLIEIPKDENIRIEFNQNIPKDENINISKIYIKQNAKSGVPDTIVEDMSVSINKNNDLDFKHTYDDKDKYLMGIIYEFYIDLGYTYAKYSFYTKINNNTTENKTPYVITGFLSSDEQQIYDRFKQDNKIDVFKDKEPKIMVKFYTQAIMEKNYDLAYNLFDDEISKEDYIKTLKDFDTNTLNNYVKTLKASLDGEFKKDNEENGYIEYEETKGHPLALDMIKIDGIWKVKYLQSQ